MSKQSDKIDRIAEDVAIIKDNVLDMKPKVTKNTAFRHKSIGVLTICVILIPLIIKYFGEA